MGYQMQNGRYADTQDLSLAGSAERTATGAGAAIEVGDRGTVRVGLVVSAASGTTPTLDVKIQASRDGVTWYDTGVVFTQKTAIATIERKNALADRYVRAHWTIGGTTPAFTFAVTGEAV